MIEEIILKQININITDNETIYSLYIKCSVQAVKHVCSVIDDIQNNKIIYQRTNLSIWMNTIK